MQSQMMARAAYSTQNTPIRTPRGTEYDVVARVTQRLRAAALLGRPGFPALAEAVHANRRLWTMLAADVADQDNPLPAELRARIFYLAEFTHDYSGRVLSKEASVAPLLEINAAVMRGLRAGGAGE
ncbi:flagellar biosynthesis regulator FlaF [Aquicoccus sp.]|uniref:flagellar biosynthesis regulator FlaF n=2 Tax=Aquicoccus sp. TaxID=2055851 RepID=UPI003564281B